MKLLLLGSLIFTGGGALALENETVNEVVTDTSTQVREMFQKRSHNNLLETVKESGYPYPSEDRLASLTEDQAFAITSAIDVINASNDWQSMSDDEITDALAAIHMEMQELHLSLGIEQPSTQTRTRSRLGGKAGHTGENYLYRSQDGTCNNDTLEQ